MFVSIKHFLLNSIILMENKDMTIFMIKMMIMMTNIMMTIIMMMKMINMPKMIIRKTIIEDDGADNKDDDEDKYD